MTTVAALPRVLVTAPGRSVSVPSWAKGFKPDAIAGSQLSTLRELPDITVVQAEAPGSVLQNGPFLSALAERHAKADRRSTILFVFAGRSQRPKHDQLRSMLKFFPDSFRNVGFAHGAQQAAVAFEEAVAKISLAGEVADREDPLSKVGALVAATADLRSDSGRLSAQRISNCFGLPKSDVARLLGRSRQAVSKTDDAESAQAGLAPFERIARLRTVLLGEAFSHWLRQGNELLDGQTPIDLIRDGRANIVADLADDMLSGSPA